MSQLEVVFRLGLAHPLLIMDSTSTDAEARYPDTGNTVCAELIRGPWPEGPNERGVFDVVLLHVTRDCNPVDRDEARYYAKLEEWGIVRDAATTLWRLLEYIRDEDFLLSKTVAGYPAVSSESPQTNPVVQTARAEVIFDGESLSILPLGGVPSIQIAGGVWDRVCLRLKRDEEVPAYRSFLLDAYYFATSGDPIRAVIMGCAAWETALKQFLLSKGEKNVERENLPGLRKRVEALKGDSLFDPKEFNDQRPDPITRLAGLRNKLLHRGEKDFSKEDIVGMMLTVDAALGWLFPQEWDSKNLVGFASLGS